MRLLAPLALALLGCGGGLGAGARDARTVARRFPALVEELPRARFTVLEFFSSRCTCQKAHDERLRRLASELAPRGVQVIAVDSEATAGPAKDEAERARRGYAWPIVSDPRGEWADAFGAEFGTFVLVLDPTGAVRYRGGIDSDRAHLSDGATPWLRDALVALVEGREPPLGETRALGCLLER